MEIEYKGANGLVLKAGSIAVVVDPKLSLVGQKDLKVDGTVELVTSPQFTVDSNARPKLLIEGPGEYEVAGISVTGIRASAHYNKEAKAVIYRLDIAGFRVGVLGHVTSPLSESQLELLGIVDIVIIPVGGNGYTLDAHEAAAIIRQISPKIVIPTHYKGSGLKYEVTQDDLSGFLKELGATQHETTEKLKMKAGIALPAILTVIEVQRS